MLAPSTSGCLRPIFSQFSHTAYGAAAPLGSSHGRQSMASPPARSETAGSAECNIDDPFSRDMKVCMGSACGNPVHTQPGRAAQQYLAHAITAHYVHYALGHWSSPVPVVLVAG
jgi:hypothetical protein